MPDEHVPVLQSMGAAILLLTAALWVFALYTFARRGHFGPIPGLAVVRGPRVLPRRRQSAPHIEFVELTPAERAAFAGLVRQLSDGRRGVRRRRA
ncbi:hypothetical protein ACIRP3_25535 [Streptomyces sp. NPDC101209]|uniref:hypothetical protein n=1 Tax=Streptomyces sp. NPDC101209 TaxID=3366129 RepID=UPI00380CDB48